MKFSVRSMLAGGLLITMSTACASEPGIPDPTATASSPTSSSPPVSAAPLEIARIINFQTPDGERTARIHHPDDVRPGAPLIVVLHPATVSAADTETTHPGQPAQNR